MANTFLLPFDNNPVNTEQTATSYTVPSGKYAIASVTVSATARPTSEAIITAAVTGFNGNSSSSSVNATFRLQTGDVLTKTETPATATATSTTANGEALSVSDTSLATALINGTAACTVNADGAAFLPVENTATALTIGVTGTATVTWHIAEFTITA